MHRIVNGETVEMSQQEIDSLEASRVRGNQKRLDRIDQERVLREERDVIIGKFATNVGVTREEVEKLFSR